MSGCKGVSVTFFSRKQGQIVCLSSVTFVEGCFFSPDQVINPLVVNKNYLKMCIRDRYITDNNSVNKLHKLLFLVGTLLEQECNFE